MTKVYSTNYSGNYDIFKYKKLVLENAAIGCSEITIITAYYSDDYLLEVIRKWCASDSVKRVKIVVSGQAKLNTEFGLKEIEAVANFDKNKIEIRINVKHAIMHTKLFRFRNSTEQSSEYILGSANASHAAFKSNEELMVGLSSSRKLQMYCKKLWEASIPLSKFKKTRNNIKHNSIESLFQNGHLYIKYARSLTLTYQPSKWIADLLKIKSKGIGFGDGKVGDFNIEKYIREKYESETARDVENAKLNPGEQLKKYSLETNLGLWVPNEYLQKLIDLLDDKKGKRDSTSSMLSSRISDVDGDKVFDDMFETIKSNIPPDSTFEDKKIDEERTKFIEWLKRIKNKLDISTKENDVNHMTKTRYIEDSVYYLTPMPSIWSDPVEVSEFFDTVFESIAETKSSSLVAKSIHSFLEKKELNVSKSNFEKALINWSNDCWKDGRKILK